MGVWVWAVAGVVRIDIRLLRKRKGITDSYTIDRITVNAGYRSMCNGVFPGWPMHMRPPAHTLTALYTGWV